MHTPHRRTLYTQVGSATRASIGQCVDSVCPACAVARLPQFPPRAMRRGSPAQPMPNLGTSGSPLSTDQPANTHDTGQIRVLPASVDTTTGPSLWLVRWPVWPATRLSAPCPLHQPPHMLHSMDRRAVAPLSRRRVLSRSRWPPGRRRVRATRGRGRWRRRRATPFVSSATRGWR